VAAIDPKQPVGDNRVKSILTCLLFVGDQAGKAEEAITLYTSVFAGSEITSIERYGADDGDGETEGSIKAARFTLNGVEHVAMDSSLRHEFAFTPAMSFLVECESKAEFESAYQALSDGGVELMPPDDYGFSQKFVWLNDRYGVSWQLNLA
jgi:predicted 3-demethylubiquinone-9 3-methyltransferase (glyoxalase superfamily)